VANKEKQKKEMNKSISVKLPDDLLEKARDKSANTGVALSFVVRKALEDWVREELPQANESSA
jgi:predicted DNA-binding protein